MLLDRSLKTALVILTRLTVEICRRGEAACAFVENGGAVLPLLAALPRFGRGTMRGSC